MNHTRYIKLIFAVIITILFAQSCSNTQSDKIKLSEEYSNNGHKPKTTLTTLQVYPKDKQNIAIFKFENDTKDQSLNWLQRGLADLFSNELSQSPYLNIITPARINELLKDARKNPKTSKDVNLSVARKLNAQIILSGRYYYEGDSLCIDVEMRNAKSGKLFKIETARGAGMEKLFSMVGKISSRIRNTLLNERSEPKKDFTEITNSIDAFRCYSKAQDYGERYIWDKSLELLREAVKHDSTFALAYFQLAKMEFNNQNYKEGERYLNKAEKYQNNLSAGDKIGLKLYKIMREEGFEAHLKALENAVHDNPANVDLRISLARQYRNLGFFDKAIDQFEIALDYDPNRRAVYNEMAYAYMFIGDYPSALRSIDRYLQLSPNEPNPFDSKGEILLQAGHFKEAKKEFRKALKIYPDFNNSIGRMAEINTFIGDKKEARHYIKRLSELKNLRQGSSDFSNYKFYYYWKFREFALLKKMILQTLNKDLDLSTVLLAADFYRSINDTAMVNSIYERAFTYYGNQLKKNGENQKYLDIFRRFSIVSKYKSAESLGILVDYMNHFKNEQQKMDFYFTLGLLAARDHQFKRAQKYFDSANLHDFHRLLQKVRIINWSNTWKYVFESSKYFNKNKAPEDLSADMLLEIGKKNKRRDLEVLAHLMKAQYFKQNNHPVKMAEEFKLAGVPVENKWLFLGPFDSYGINGFDNKYIHEDNINLPEPVKYKGKEFRWLHSDDKLCDGYIDLKTALKKSDWKTAYALIKVYAPAETRAQFRLSSVKSCKVFLNNSLVWQHYNLYDDFIDQDIITVILHEGYNTILLKLANNINNWGFYFRITDEDGRGLSNIKYYAADELKPDELSMQ